MPSRLISRSWRGHYAYNTCVFSGYQAVRLALRRAMARWWRRTGRWLLLALLSGALLDALIGGAYLPWYELSARQHMWFAPQATLLGTLAATAYPLLPPLLLILASLSALLASAHALTALQALTHDVPCTSSRDWQRLRLMVALAASWLPLAIATLSSTGTLTLLVFLAARLVLPGLEPASMALRLVPAPAGLLLAMLWILGLLAAAPDRPQYATGAYLALIGAPALRLVMYAVSLFAILPGRNPGSVFTVEAAWWPVMIGSTAALSCSCVLLYCAAAGRSRAGGAWLALLLSMSLLSLASAPDSNSMRLPRASLGDLGAVQRATVLAEQASRSALDTLTILPVTFTHNTLAQVAHRESGRLSLRYPVPYSVDLASGGAWLVLLINTVWLGLCLALVVLIPRHRAALR